MLKIFIIVLFPVLLASAVITTAHYDNTQQGVNNTETTLTPTNVAMSGFGFLWKSNLNNSPTTQPLYVPSSLNGTSHDLMFEGTASGYLYGLDAHSGSIVWSGNFGATPCSGSYAPIILGTPVIDVPNGWIFFVSTASITGTCTATIYKVNLSTGAAIASTVIGGSYPGTGAGTIGGCTDVVSGGNVIFDLSQASQYQHTPIKIINGNIYFGFGSGAASETSCTFHGWVFGYDEATLTQQAILNTSPNSNGSGVWGSASGTGSDGTYLYFATGNGTAASSTDLPMSMIKTDLSLNVLASYTLSNWSTLSASDSDFNSGRVMLLGNGSLVIGSKDGYVRVFADSTLTLTQSFAAYSVTPGGSTGIFGGLIFQGAGYFPNHANPTCSFALTGSTFATSSSACTSGNFSQNGLAGTSNDGANRIVWSLSSAGVAAAYNASTLGILWSYATGQVASPLISPSIVDGLVFMPTKGGVFAFGLLPSGGIRGAVAMRGSATLR